MKNENEQTIPMIIFLLNQNKFHEIIKAMLNKQVSKNIMEDYGQKQSQYTLSQQHRIKQAVSRFSILEVLSMLIRKQLVELKGSTPHRIKDYHNSFLYEMIRRKLYGQQVCSQTRRSYWIQMSEFFPKRRLYDDLKQLQIASDLVNAIEKDIIRTSKPKSILVAAQQVLQIFAKFNPYIGYCQGMNTIAAFLIQRGFTCAQSFFIMKKVTQDLLPCDFYTNMNNVMAYTRIVYESLSILQPDLYQHMKTISNQMDGAYIVMVSFVLQWFVCLFCNDNICPAVTQVIWDFFIIQGITSLFKATFAIFELLKPHILKCKNFEQYNVMQKDIICKIKDANYIRKRIIQMHISPKILFLLKQKLMETLNSQKNQKEKKTIIFKKECNRCLNVCLQVIEDNAQQNKYYQNFVFKTNKQIQIIDNYLQTLHKQYFTKQKHSNKINLLMIGRISHICRNSSDTITEGSLSDKNNDNYILKTPSRKNNQTPNSLKNSPQTNDTQIRLKIAQKISQISGKIPTMHKSDSVKFMEQMVQHGSISNLLQIYEIDEFFQ